MIFNHQRYYFALLLLMWLYTTPQSYDFFLKLARISGESFEKSYFWTRPSRHGRASDDCYYPQGIAMSF